MSFLYIYEIKSIKILILFVWKYKLFCTIFDADINRVIMNDKRRDLRDVIGKSNGSQSSPVFDHNGKPLGGKQTFSTFDEYQPDQKRGEFNIKLVPGYIAVAIPPMPKLSFIVSDQQRAQWQAETFKNGMRAYKIISVAEGSMFNVGEYAYVDLSETRPIRYNVRGHIFWLLSEQVIAFTEGDVPAYKEYEASLNETLNKVNKAELPPEKTRVEMIKPAPVENVSVPSTAPKVEE